MTTVVTPPTSILELCVPPASAVEARVILERALDTIVELGCEEAMVAIVLPRGVEARATPGLDIPSEDELRAIGAGLRHGTDHVIVSPGDRSLIGHVNDIGAGGQVLALGAVPPEAAEVFERWVPVVLLALSRAGLVIHDRRRDAEVARLQETAQRVAASLDLDDVLSEIVRDAAELLGADSGDMLLLDEHQQMLRVVAVANFPSEMVGFEMDLGEGVSSRAMSARRAVVVNDYERYRHRVKRLDRYRFRSVLCAPLIARGQPIGALNVHATHTGRRFGQEDARLLTTFANHAAIAIDNATRYRNEVRLAEDLAHANRELDRSLTLQQRIVRQILLDRGLAGVAKELAEVLERAVVVQDDLLHVVAGADPESWSSRNGGPWQDLALPRDVSSAEGLREILDRVRGTGVPAELPSTGSGAARVIAPIRLGSETAGYLVLHASGALDPLDRALLEVAGTGVALEFAKLRAQVAFEQRLQGDVVGDLIARSYASAGSITARAARIGLDLSVPCDVIIVRIDAPTGIEDALSGERLTELRRRFAEVLQQAATPGAVATIQAEAAVILTPADEDGRGPAEALAADLLETLREQIPELGFSVAIGDRCSSPDDYQPSFRLAIGALDATAKLGRPGQVVNAADLGVSRLLISAVDARELHRFASRSLGPLLEGGDRRGELLGTLEAYVEAGFNQRETARRSFVHFNTVAYRLRRIEEILGVDLDDPRARLDLTLALRIATLAGLSPRHNEGRPDL
ncbi:MAG TPA: GAF domain-containing protein [Actinomycetota bacterium]|nr:GAF domain-containing protein [Actinomycetota bacterium]